MLIIMKCLSSSYSIKIFSLNLSQDCANKNRKLNYKCFAKYKVECTSTLKEMT